jgi:hypothetical protein
MLAEIFMVHAEALARNTKEKLPVSSSPFIPLDGALQFKLKGSARGAPPEALTESPTKKARNGLLQQNLPQDDIVPLPTS